MCRDGNLRFASLPPYRTASVLQHIHVPIFTFKTSNLIKYNREFNRKTVLCWRWNTVSLTAEYHRCWGAHHCEEWGILGIVGGHPSGHTNWLQRKEKNEPKTPVLQRYSFQEWPCQDAKDSKEPESLTAKSRIPQKSSSPAERKKMAIQRQSHDQPWVHEPFPLFRGGPINAQCIFQVYAVIHLWCVAIIFDSL